MALGSLSKGGTFDVKAEATVESGDVVLVGDATGVAITSAADDIPGNVTGDPYVTVAMIGEWVVDVTGSPTIGAAVYVDPSSASAGEAVTVAATVTAATGLVQVGVVTGITTSGQVLLALTGPNAIAVA